MVAGETPILVHNDSCTINGVTFPDFDSGKTAANVGDQFTLSGYGADVPTPFVRPTLGQTLAVQNSVGKDRVASFMDNNAGLGAYNLSHAEKQAYVLNPSGLITVTRPVCADCTEFFMRAAQTTGQQITVVGPEGANFYGP